MSRVTLSALAPRSGTTVSLGDNVRLRGLVASPGAVVQTILVRSDVRSTFSAPNSGQGTTVSPLSLTITPRLPESLVVCQWMVNGEMHQDATFQILKDGWPHEGGSNGEVRGLRSAGYTTAFYDQNEDSTPSNWHILFSDRPGSTRPVVYALAVRSSSSGGYTLALNRTLNGSTGNNYESMVSVAMAQEVVM